MNIKTLGNKKAAIELSVTAIVVLILAIVILGLGLGFIRGMFSKVSTQFEQQIANEPEPPTTSRADPLTLSRESIITNSGATEVIKIGIMNPTSKDWAADIPWGCKNFTTQTTCGTAAQPQYGCNWQIIGTTYECSGTATACTAITAVASETEEQRCKKQKGCMWDTTLATHDCVNAVGAAPELKCAGISGNLNSVVNRKVIMAGDSAVFNYLMTIPTGIEEKTYLCEVVIGDYQKDLTIRVTK